MILQPARVEQAFFTKQAPKLIRHIKPVLPLEADGLVADVYDQMAQEFQLTPPVILHSPIPDLLASVWGAQREAMVAGPTSRALRETVSEAVSAINQCSFCVDAHSTLLNGLGQRSTAEAIRAHRPDLIEDAQTRKVAEWAFANRQPGAHILQRPPFSPDEAGEIIGSAVLFHYIDRVVSVFLSDSPVQLPPKLRWLKGSAIRLAGRVVGRRVMGLTVNAGDAVGAVPAAAPSPEFCWAESKPALAAAYGKFEAVVEGLGRDVVAEPVRTLVQKQIHGWRGSDPGLSRSWVEQAVKGLAARDQPAGRLTLLVALAPYQVDEDIVTAFRAEQPTDVELLATVSWASFLATRRVAGWLAPSSP